jgi:hypothetical protein
MNRHSESPVIVPLLWLNLAYAAHNANHETSKWLYVSVAIIGLIGMARGVYLEVKSERESR